MLQTLRFKDQAYACYEMLKYVAEHGQSVAPTAVVVLTERLHGLQQFTSDPAILVSAINRFRPQKPILRGNLAPPGSSVPADMEGHKDTSGQCQ